VAQAELELRATTVARRADLRERPWLDADGLLWFRDRWAVVPRGQGPVIEALAANFGRVLRDEEIRRVFESSANSIHAEAVKTSMRRVSDLLGPLGLTLERVRGSGYLLERQD
jgi:DNA-binding response OmpR family regulator